MAGFHMDTEHAAFTVGWGRGALTQNHRPYARYPYGSRPSHVTGRGGTQGKIAVLAPPVELPINRKWTSRYAKRKVRPDSESLRRGEHNAPISNTHRRRPYGNLGDRPLGGRYVRYGITAGVGLERKLITEVRPDMPYYPSEIV